MLGRTSGLCTVGRKKIGPRGRWGARKEEVRPAAKEKAPLQSSQNWISAREDPG